MIKKYFIVLCFICSGFFANAQKTLPDTIPPVGDASLAMDTSIDYDDLMSEFDNFLDSILAPRSYFLASVSAAQGYFNYNNKNNTGISVFKKYTFSPSIGYYGKGGFGFTITGNVVSDSQQLNLYQLSFGPSFDYLKNRDMALGVAFIRFRTKDSLRFYVSPLQNELSGYFLWRKSWLQPGIAVSYGWGSHTEYKKRLQFIERLNRRILILTETENSIADFSLTASLRHDFYWRNIFSKKDKDYFRLSPQLVFASGTQKFGFNQNTGTYGATRMNLLYSAGNVNLDDELKFQPVSLTLYLGGEYSVGKFFLQPQFIFDYYFPAKDKNFSALFSINAGFMF